MQRNFYYDKIEFKGDEKDGLVVSGEITNYSGRDYNAVVFRFILFTSNIPIGNVVINIHGFRKGQTRYFEKQIGELKYSEVIKKISHYEIYPESSY